MRGTTWVVLALGLVAAGAITATYTLTQWARADPLDPLAYLRQRLQNFQTLWVRFEIPPTGGAKLRTSAVLRIDAATGRLSIDHGARILWDGTHLWIDGSPHEPAERMGDAADAMMAELMTELLAGLPNTTIIPPLQEDWGGRTQSGWRLDLPFTWDDDYAILLGGLTDRDPTRLQIIVKQTKEPARFGGRTLRLSVREVRWDVRLLDDLSDPEDLGSRRFLVSPPDAWDEISEGPSMLPGYHVETTTHAMWFDPSGSNGWVAPDGQQTPQTWMQDVICPGGGQAFTAPIDLRYTLDPAAESSLFLQDAMAAGCPMTLRMEVVHRHHPTAGAKTRVQGLVRLQDTSTQPPTVLGTRVFDETVTGPNTGDRLKVHEIEGLPPFTPGGLELTFQGATTVQCVEATTAPSSVTYGMTREEPPVLAWTGCYPELGVVPDP